MSSTILTDLAVEVIDTPQGPGWVLYEKLYESNVSPKTPKWCIIAVGRREQVLGTLFTLAGQCASGLLRGPRGSIQAVAYLVRWRKAFKKAGVLQGAVAHAGKRYLDNSSPYYEISDAEATPLTPEQRAAWGAGETLQLSLADDFDQIAWLIKTSRLSIWRGLWGSPTENLPTRDCAREVFRAAAMPNDFKAPLLVRLFAESQVLYEDLGGVLQFYGHKSSIESSVSAIFKVELTNPGHFIKNFQALRQAAQDAVLLDQHAFLTADEPSDARLLDGVHGAHAARFRSCDIKDAKDRYAVERVRRYRVLAPQPVVTAYEAQAWEPFWALKPSGDLLLSSR